MDDLLNKTTLFVICLDLLFFFFFAALDPHNPKTGGDTGGGGIPYLRQILLLAVLSANLWYFLA